MADAGSANNLEIPGKVGVLQAALQLPQSDHWGHIGIVCHPHPQQGGTMDNKVVTTVAKTFHHLGMAALRFNYRGVGDSDGSFGAIEGEVQDCMSVLDWVQRQWPQCKITLAGFSFGAYIAAFGATQIEVQNLISIAPSVERMPYADLAPIKCPWLVVQGEEDEVVDPQAVYAWYAQLQADKQLVKLPATGHFFHGKLTELREIITEFMLD